MKLKNIIVTREMVYSPEPYLKFCKDSGEDPTQQGFEEYISDWIDHDFANCNAEETITTE